MNDVMTATDAADYGIENLADLVRAVADGKTGGYDVDLNVLPNLEKSRSGDGFFLLVEVTSNEPGNALTGEWWFDDDNRVMQVM